MITCFTADYLGKGLPVYTFKTTCSEDTKIKLEDGITKIIINSTAAGKEKNPDLKNFLDYMNGKISNDGFIQKIEQRIREVKENEQLRKEYMLINSFERDARNDGWKAGMQAGIAQGRTEGFSDGIRQTAKILKQLGDSTQKIMQATGLTQAEVEALS